MATNLLISTPGIESSANIQTHTAEDSDYPAENACYGGRASTFRTGAAVTQSQIDLDLESGNDLSPDHLIVTRLNLLTDRDSADITVTVKGDDNSSFSSAQSFSDTPGTSDLLGANSEDWIQTFSPSQAERYWRVQFDTTETEVHEINFIRLGIFFDMGRDPVYGAKLEPIMGTPGSKRRGYEIRLDWEGITSAKQQAFKEQVVANADVAPVFLYDQNDYCLDGKRLMACRLTSFSSERTAVNEYSVSADFRELI
jgi:hypothetical protein